MAEIIPFPIQQSVRGEVQTISLGVFLGAAMGGDGLETFRQMAMAETRLTALRVYDIPTLRRFWDRVGDNSFYEGPEGSFDCADIHRVLNEKGDGRYCAV